MERNTPLHRDAAIIDRMGRMPIRQRFNLTRQAIYNWRRRGVPKVERMPFARWLLDQDVPPPAHFFEEMER